MRCNMEYKTQYSGTYKQCANKAAPNRAFCDSHSRNANVGTTVIINNLSKKGDKRSTPRTPLIEVNGLSIKTTGTPLGTHTKICYECGAEYGIATEKMGGRPIATYIGCYCGVVPNITKNNDNSRYIKDDEKSLAPSDSVSCVAFRRSNKPKLLTSGFVEKGSVTSSARYSTLSKAELEAIKSGKVVPSRPGSTAESRISRYSINDGARSLVRTGNYMPNSTPSLVSYANTDDLLISNGKLRKALEANGSTVGSYVATSRQDLKKQNKGLRKRFQTKPLTDIDE